MGAAHGDAPGRYAFARARKNYAGTSPLTIQSGKKKTVIARYIRNRHLIDAAQAQALTAISTSPGARAYYDELKRREIGHNDALRRVASRLQGILHGPENRARLRRGRRLAPPCRNPGGR